MGHVHLTEPEHEAFCGTSSFEEFRQFDLNNLGNEAIAIRWKDQC